MTPCVITVDYLHKNIHPSGAPLTKYRSWCGMRARPKYCHGWTVYSPLTSNATLTEFNFWSFCTQHTGNVFLIVNRLVRKVPIYISQRYIVSQIEHEKKLFLNWEKSLSCPLVRSPESWQDKLESCDTISKNWASSSIFSHPPTSLGIWRHDMYLPRCLVCLLKASIQRFFLKKFLCRLKDKENPVSTWHFSSWKTTLSAEALALW